MTMPARLDLTWRSITEGSRLVLPSYPAVFCTVGAILLLQSSDRTVSPAFDSAKWVMAWTGVDPIKSWGALFVTIGILEAAACCCRRRRAFVWLLVLASGVCAFWASLLFCSAASSPVVSFTAGVWVSHSAWCHIASVRSLTRDLVIR